MATQGTPVPEKATRWMNEKPEVKAGFTVKEFTGTFPDPDIPGKEIEAGYYSEVPTTVVGLTSFANDRELKDKNFSELVGINKLAYDAAVLIARREAMTLITGKLEGPAVTIEKAVKKLMATIPGLTENQARALATAGMEQASANKTV